MAFVAGLISPRKSPILLIRICPIATNFLPLLIKFSKFSFLIGHFIGVDHAEHRAEPTVVITKVDVLHTVLKFICA